MTEEEIKQKATETYPKHEFGIYVKDNELKREGYTKALTELEFMPKIKGWVARDKSMDLFFYYIDKPERKIDCWGQEGLTTILDPNMFPEITWESEPIEVELIIRKL